MPGAVRLPVIVGVTHDQPVDDHLDGVALVLVERLDLVKIHQFAIDADAHEALPASGLEDAIALRLAVAHERPQDEQPGPVG